MNLQTPKAQINFFKFIFDINMLALFYACDKILKLFYTGVCMYLLYLFSTGNLHENV